MLKKKEEIKEAFISIYNSEGKKLAILLIILDYEKYHYIALKGITSKNNGDVYCLNCFHLFQTKSKLQAFEKVWKYQSHYDVKMPNEMMKYKSVFKVKNLS